MKVSITITDAEYEVAKEILKVVERHDKKVEYFIDRPAFSQYAIIFDRTYYTYRNSYDINLLTLKYMENYTNELLRFKGKVTLAEVYDIIGKEMSEKERYKYEKVGWRLNSKNGDGYIDFNLPKSYSPVYEFSKGNVIPGAILLDFNVDGVLD